ncbi:hypothetical protein A2767_05330 [Candidatus Roizmanbacteria bacterium RIFCSPHIGHO2_01_FULL_35_10]|uniref:DUF1003 domain-containing protein n=1 Tax=Candidatus Roizmanbacteria bacterium RIFCSPLOWO2_01_FULL_35_13 TaxID=1802055 RepID=A0A1F7IC02_9BACT|nr:MAG: hypothetical protein A2767_05330 [Candidatus Roizmanbacteria bacterium RIFCSPHIGHO2_01_FULL_35_10]OGK40872.1 MAG: hypothetical protein A3A74_06015 [Candidatus Roizmanbacteria bacterium RIFCSPLOWO2_01_FULL_35_13]
MSNSSYTSRHALKSLKARYQAKRSSWEKIADWMTANFGNAKFLFVNLLFFLVWLIINVGVIEFIEPFDPYPFGLLTTIVSLEAIILSIFILISQNRGSKIDDLREEIDLQIDIITESETTKLMKLVVLLLHKNGIDVSDDKELEQMLKPINEEKIERSLEKQMENNSKP